MSGNRIIFEFGNARMPLLGDFFRSAGMICRWT